MEHENIDWSNIESIFEEDDYYENINAPKWIDLSAPCETVDDEAWFCKPGCRHPKCVEDYLKSKHYSKNHTGLRSSLTLEFYRKAYEHIVEKYPYWNHSAGRDHIWSFSWDEGACYAPKEIWNSMILVHWGNTNSEHNHSTTAYWADNWDNIPSDRRGNHPCFDPAKDLVLPAWKQPDVTALSAKLLSRPRDKQNTLFYFNGNPGPAYTIGRPEAA